MTDYNSVNISIKVGCFIKILEYDNYEEVENKPYQQLIRKLMYLLCGMRPNIAFAIGQLSKHNSHPKIGYIKLTKKVIRYLKDTIHLGFIYGAKAKDVRETKASIALFLFGLIGYKNSSYAGDLEDRKLVIGYCYFFNRAIIFWYSKK